MHLGQTPMEAASESLVAQIHRLARLTRRVQHEAEIIDLAVLARLEDEGPLDVAEIAARERRPATTVSGAVASLAERGAVRRVADEAGGSGPRLEVTDTGRSMLADDMRRHTEITARRIGAAGTWATVDVQRAADILRDLLDAEETAPEAVPSLVRGLTTDPPA